jgi:Saxitoxin biosynthesis operon protein SxtJ
MVAGAAYYCAYNFRFVNHSGRQFCTGAIYLHLILMKQSQRYKELETILTLVLAFGVFYWKYKKPWLLLIAFIIGLIGLLIPVVAKAIHWLWMKLAEGMGFVTSKVILTLIFIIIVIPLGWISKKMGKSSVKIKQGGASYFKERNHTYTKEDLENMW